MAWHVLQVTVTTSPIPFEREVSWPFWGCGSAPQLVTEAKHTLDIFSLKPIMKSRLLDACFHFR